MTEQEKRLHRCCFTGHRPEKLNCSEKEVKVWLRQEIENAISNGYTTFISGTARGVDLWAAEIVIDLRESGEPIKLICAIPFKGTEERWERGWKKTFNRVVSQADYARYICDEYNIGVYQVRNEWMVDHSTRVIAVFNGQPSGTKNLIQYARFLPNIMIVNYYD